MPSHPPPSSSCPLPKITPNTPITLTPEPLLPSTFAPFGTAILSPLPQHLRSVPSSPPPPLHPGQQPGPQPANQNTALKTSPISPLTNNYADSSSPTAAKGLMSIFSCFPRKNTFIDERTGKLRLKLEILERHPFTSQTFCPFNFSSSSSLPSKQSRGRRGTDSVNEGEPEPTYFLILVAPTLDSPSSSPSNPPDLSHLRAFLAPVTADKGLGMAVTYAPGTWHAPMVVLGDRRVDFLVTQFANGVGIDDCQEVLVGEGVSVDLKGLGIGRGSEVENGGVEGANWGLWRAKL